MIFPVTLLTLVIISWVSSEVVTYDNSTKSLERQLGSPHHRVLKLANKRTSHVPMRPVIDLDTYTFKRFLSDFNLKYASEERNFRKSLFQAELDRVRAHNGKGLSWKEGINRFSVMTHNERQFYRGRSKARSGIMKAKAKSRPLDLPMQPVSQLPKHVDWRSKGIFSAVNTQEFCGSSWAVAANDVIEAHLALKLGQVFSLSVEQTFKCALNSYFRGSKSDCCGASPEVAFDYISASPGLWPSDQYEYSPYYGVFKDCSMLAGGSPVAKIGGFVSLPENNYTVLMNVLASVGPVAVALDSTNLAAYESGIFNGCNPENPHVDHVAVLVGYGTENGLDYWLVRNSWSVDYGEAGYVKILRTNQEETLCGLDRTKQLCSGPSDAAAAAAPLIKVCGTCSILADASFPTDVSQLS